MVSYLQLAHNERYPQTDSPVAKVINNFGRADLMDRAALALWVPKTYATRRYSWMMPPGRARLGLAPSGGMGWSG